MNDIFNTQFWKQRLDTARKQHYSVYVTNDYDWRIIEAQHKRILAHCVTGRTLDAGCGYGRMASFFDPSEYVGVDLSPDFIALAKSQYPRHTFVCGDLRRLPFDDGEFDWAFCISIKRMVRRDAGEEAWQEIQKDLQRVAKKVLILEYEDPEKYEVL